MRCAILLLYCLAAIPASRAEVIAPRHTGTPLLRVWRARDYRAAQQNWRIAITASGLVYVANHDGVLEFDGEEWRLIRLPREGPARALVIDAGGAVWAAGHDDVCRLEPDDAGSLRAISMLERLAPEERAVGMVSRGLATAEGVWFRSRTRTVYFGRDGTARSWASPDTPALLWQQGNVVYADLGPIARIQGETVTPASPDFAAAGAVPLAFLRVFGAEVTEGQPALLLASRGPVHWRGAGTPMLPVSAAARALFENGLATAGEFLSDGRLAFGTERAGLHLLSRGGRLLQSIDHSHGLPPARINDLAMDAEGGLWLALDDAVARLALDAPFALHGAAQGLRASPRQLAATRDRLYVAHSAGVARRDTTNGQFVPIAGFEIGAARVLVTGDRVLAATRGLLEITGDDRTRLWTRVLVSPLVPASRAPGWLFAGTSRGLALIAPDPGSDGWQQQPVPTTLTRELEELLDTGDGFVWAVDRNGVVLRADFQDWSGGTPPVPIVRIFGVADGIPAVTQRERVRLFALDRTVMVASSQWFRRFDPATERFERVSVRHAGTEFFGASALGPGAAGGIWFQPGHDPSQIVHWAPGGKLSVHSMAELGALRLEFLLEEAATRTLWLAAEGVLASVDLAWQPARPAPPVRTLIRRVQTTQGEIVFGGAGQPPDEAPRRLASSRNALRFEFAAPTFTTEHSGRAGTLYRTKLEGLEEAWTPWTSAPHREFTNLPYRALAFRVQARSLDGRVSEETAYRLAIAPPWWLTPWAFGSYVVAGVAGLAGIVRLRTRALKRRAEHLETIVAARTEELRRQNVELARLHRLELDEKTAARLAEEKARLELLRYQLNPHFLANAFATVRSLVYSKPDSAGEMLGRLTEFCRSALTRTDESGGTVADEVRLIESYLATEQARWRDLLVCRIGVDPRVAAERLPPFLLQPLVENAVKYGGRTSPEKLEVKVRIGPLAAENATAAGERSQPIAGAVEIEVANTGAWIEPETNPEVSTRIGLENLRQRLRRYYPDAHTMVIRHDDGWVRVILQLRHPARDPFAAARPR